ncbi:hypothetical protein J2Z66_002444 [Paenibacillus eucommiae]|uniref:Uncharacterized protein n=1 Tax=Paenibacillus eucommiae TaxID=1355755 RepID=A0ABS4ITJ8_9BACL|nr:hypothetical protein [Paenibacillus eucommiae]
MSKQTQKSTLGVIVGNRGFFQAIYVNRGVKRY